MFYVLQDHTSQIVDTNQNKLYLKSLFLTQLINLKGLIIYKVTMQVYLQPWFNPYHYYRINRSIGEPSCLGRNDDLIIDTMIEILSEST